MKNNIDSDNVLTKKYSQDKVLVISSIIITIFSILLFIYSWQKRPLVNDDITSRSIETKIKVQLNGEISKPGIYELPLGVNIADLLKKSEPKFNIKELPKQWLDLTLIDGNVITVTVDSKKQPNITVGMMSGQTATLLLLKMDLNTATLEDLITISGVGHTLATSIIEHRKKNGPFRKIEDLNNVKGIGDKTLEHLSKFLAIGQEVK